MSELAQELEIPAAATSIQNDGINNKNQENNPEDSIDFNLLSLDSHNPCTACGCCGCSPSPPPPRIIPATTSNICFSSNNKRRSLDPTAPFLDPSPQGHQVTKRPKKLFLDNQTQETTNTYSKITLPSISSHPPTPVLRRTKSDPCSSAVAHLLESLSKSVANQTPQSPPENVKKAGETTPTAAAPAATTPVSKAANAALPPRPPLVRTVSDPSPNKSHSTSSSSTDSAADCNPNYKLLKKMKDCIKEMSQWWDDFLPGADQVTGQEHEEDKATEDTNATNCEEAKGTEDANSTKADLVTDSEEDVCVERVGECLTIHFKCPCRKGYKILLSGNDCYYKLM